MGNTYVIPSVTVVTATKKYLAYIVPLEDITGKEYALCDIIFASGLLNHQHKQAVLGTNIFRYYYYGSTFEVVEMDEHNNVVNVHDVGEKDMEEFGLSLKSVLTLNTDTYDMLVSNDFVYNIKSNKFYNNCRQTIENICRRIQEIDGFTIRTYIRDGAVIYIELDENTNSKSKYVLNRGFLVSDKSQLRQSGKVTTTPEFDKNEKLKQKDIDKIVTRLINS